jgi:hypothetical protein
MQYLDEARIHSPQLRTGPAVAFGVRSCGLQLPTTAEPFQHQLMGK